MSHPTRVVFDTSTLVGAMLRPDSVPQRAFEEAQRGSILCTSTAAFKELDSVLRRPKFDAYFPLAGRLRFLEIYRSVVTSWIVDPLSDALAHGVCRDANDAMFLALAYECKAQLLITSDADLLVLHGWQGIAIMKPSDFLAALQ